MSTLIAPSSYCGKDYDGSCLDSILQLTCIYNPQQRQHRHAIILAVQLPPQRADIDATYMHSTTSPANVPVIGKCDAWIYLFLDVPAHVRRGLESVQTRGFCAYECGENDVSRLPRYFKSTSIGDGGREASAALVRAIHA